MGNLGGHFLGSEAVKCPKAALIAKGDQELLRWYV